MTAQHPEKFAAVASPSTLTRRLATRARVKHEYMMETIRRFVLAAKGSSLMPFAAKHAGRKALDTMIDNKSAPQSRSALFYFWTVSDAAPPPSQVML